MMENHCDYMMYKSLQSFRDDGNIMVGKTKLKPSRLIRDEETWINNKDF